MGDAAPTAVGCLTLVFSCVYSYLNLHDAKHLVGGLQKDEAYI